MDTTETGMEPGDIRASLTNRHTRPPVPLASVQQGLGGSGRMVRPGDWSGEQALPL
ncbi:MAG: hypothetical protein OXF26_13790 [Alphaproteobacteria bacterium]|nr:hypothetical protein [Alphaproteobacteria bacterium]